MIEYHQPGQHSNCSPERCGHPAVRAMTEAARSAQPECPASQEAVEEMEDRGEVGCPLCGKPASVHREEGPDKP